MSIYIHTYMKFKWCYHIMGNNVTPRHYKLSNKNCSARYGLLLSSLLVGGIL